MSTIAVKKKDIYKRKTYPTLYLVEQGCKDDGKNKTVYSKSAVFPIFLVVILFLCLGILFNVVLKVQSINYQNKIYETTDMISLENERADRLLLKVSELRSPARIKTIAESNLGMQMSDKLKAVKVSDSGLDNNEKIYDYIVGSQSSIMDNYDSFLGTIYHIQDIVMVVSEGILTFFIP